MNSAAQLQASHQLLHPHCCERRELSCETVTVLGKEYLAMTRLRSFTLDVPTQAPHITTSEPASVVVDDDPPLPRRLRAAPVLDRPAHKDKRWPAVDLNRIDGQGAQLAQPHPGKKERLDDKSVAMGPAARFE